MLKDTNYKGSLKKKERSESEGDMSNHRKMFRREATLPALKVELKYRRDLV